MSSLDGKMTTYIEIVIAIELLAKKRKPSLAPPYKYIKILKLLLPPLNSRALVGTL